MTTASGTTYFHYSDDKVIYETDASNNIIAEYTYDPLGNPATMTKNGTTYYYHVNGHGDVVALTDGSGNTVAQYSYDAWGNIISQSGTMASENPLRYAGYMYDEVTGLYYLMARYYDPEIGRFITRDTFHGFEDDPLSLNQYAYARNNPVIYIDPDGHSYVKIIYEALKVLISKVGYDVAKKGWDIAEKYIRKALKEIKNYTIDGPGGGGRIIQVRNKKTGQPIFRLDYFPVVTGEPYTLHYHVHLI